jgi:hypothetical protein
MSFYQRLPVQFRHLPAQHPPTSQPTDKKNPDRTFVRKPIHIARDGSTLNLFPLRATRQYILNPPQLYPEFFARSAAYLVTYI